VSVYFKLIEFMHMGELINHARQKADDVVEGLFLLGKICFASIAQMGPCVVGRIVSLVISLPKVGLPQGCSDLRGGVSLNLNRFHCNMLSCPEGSCVFRAVSRGMARVAEPRVNGRAVNYYGSGYRDSLLMP
jgi:hypothetical protein